MHSCHLCQKTFSSESNLSRHVIESHETPKHVCYICGTKFKRIEYLRRHSSSGKCNMSNYEQHQGNVQHNELSGHKDVNYNRCEYKRFNDAPSADMDSSMPPADPGYQPCRVKTTRVAEKLNTGFDIFDEEEEEDEAERSEEEGVEEEGEGGEDTQESDKMTTEASEDSKGEGSETDYKFGYEEDGDITSEVSDLSTDSKRSCRSDYPEKDSDSAEQDQDDDYSTRSEDDDDDTGSTTTTTSTCQESRKSLDNVKREYYKRFAYWRIQDREIILQWCPWEDKPLARKHIVWLNRLRKTSSPKARKLLIRKARDTEIDALAEIALNLLKGRVPLTARQFVILRRYRDILRIMVSTSKTHSELKRILLSAEVNFLTNLLKYATPSSLKDTVDIFN